MLTQLCFGRWAGLHLSNLRLVLAHIFCSWAAGPLGNVILFPLFTLFAFAVTSLDWRSVHPDFYQFVLTVWFMNAGLLFLTLIPISPVEGTQIMLGMLSLR